MSAVRITLIVDTVLAAMALFFPQSQFLAKILLVIAALLAAWEVLSWVRRRYSIERRDSLETFAEEYQAISVENKELREQVATVTAERDQLNGPKIQAQAIPAVAGAEDRISHEQTMKLIYKQHARNRGDYNTGDFGLQVLEPPPGQPSERRFMRTPPSELLQRPDAAQAAGSWYCLKAKILEVKIGTDGAVTLSFYTGSPMCAVHARFSQQQLSEIGLRDRLELHFIGRIQWAAFLGVHLVNCELQPPP